MAAAAAEGGSRRRGKSSPYGSLPARGGSRPRVVCTGYHVGYPSDGVWCTANDAAPDMLRGWPTASPNYQVESGFVQAQSGIAQVYSVHDQEESVGVKCGRVGQAPSTPLTPRQVLTPEQMLAPAARELVRLGLWEKGGLTVDAERLMVCFSSSKGSFARLAQGSDYGCDYAASWWNRSLRSRGPVLAPVAACAGGAHAVALAAQQIEDGYADTAICGAIEPAQTPVVLAGYRQLGALSRDGMMRPFDRRRDGFVPACGVAMLVLESEEQARRRRAQVHGSIEGWSIAGDATAMTTMQPDGDGIARAIEGTLRRAGVQGVDYVNAHGTATRLNDAVESRGIGAALGRSVPVSSTKPLTGHWLGAAGALEAILCLRAMRESFLPPTLNLEEPDIDCDLDYIFPGGREQAAASCLSLSFGFGGHIGALLLKNS